MAFSFFVLATSWLIIYFLEKKNLFKIWFLPAGIRAKEFLKGFILMAVLSSFTQLFLGHLSGSVWSLASDISDQNILRSLVYDLNSVLFEELTFRGIVLYLMLKYLKKPQLSILLTAAAFGVYHWFTYGVIGNIMVMIVVFLVTGFMGYVFAAAYEKTNSIVLPIALHLGWNLINNTVFSNGPTGIQIFEATQTSDTMAGYDLISLIWYLILPAIVLFIIKTNIIRKYEIKNKS